MIKKIISVLFLFGYFTLFAQKIPFSYSLGFNNLAKTSDKSPNSNTIEYIEFDKDTIWLGTSNGLSKSTDSGNTWKNISFGEEGISALSINNDTVWCATWHAMNDPFNEGTVLPVGSGLHYSADGGENWVDIPQPVDAADDSSVVYGINRIRALPITSDVNNFTRSIGFTKGYIWIASFAGELRRSGNNGKTWKRVVLPPDYLDEIHPSDTLTFTLSPSGGALGFESNLNHRVFSIVSSSEKTIYVGTANGINKSTDNGLSWKKFNHKNQTEAISGNFIVDLNFDQYRNVVWASTWKADDPDDFYAVSWSADGGSSWHTLLPGLKVHDINFLISDSSGSFISKEVLVASESGIYRSPDYGKTWISAPQMMDDNTRAVLTTNDFRSVNSRYLSNNNQSLWFGSLDGLANLTETGEIWSGKWRVFVASSNTGSAANSESFAFPNPFSPDDEVVRFKYNTNNLPAKVSIRVFDFGMNLVRTVIQNASRTISPDSAPGDFWDGRDENGNIVPNGVYFYRIDFDSNIEPVFGKIIVLM